MVMPDEVDFYADCPDLRSKVKKHRAALRYPGDVQLMDDVLEFIDTAQRLVAKLAVGGSNHA